VLLGGVPDEAPLAELLEANVTDVALCRPAILVTLPT
jgi:hypothetical protein